MKENLLFSTNSQKFLSFILDYPLKDFLEVELRDKLKSGKSSAHYALKNLVSAGFLTKKKRGKRFFYTLNHKTPIIKQMKILKTIYTLESLIKKIKPLCEKIMLFGSCARGEDNIESDIDLLVVTQEKTEIKEIVSNLKSKRKIQVKIYSTLELLELEKNDPVFFDQISWGILLGGKND